MSPLPVVVADDLEIVYFVLPGIEWALIIVALLAQANHLLDQDNHLDLVCFSSL